MELVPEFWLLTRRAQSRIFQRMTVKAILTKVLEGLKVKLDGINEQGTLAHPRDYCVQYRETDFNFASRLMEEEGIYYFFKHSDKGHEMILANTTEAHPDVLERSDLSKVVYAGDLVLGSQSAEDRVYGWAKMQTLRAGKVTLRDHCFELPANRKPPFFQDLQAQEPIQPSVKAGKIDHPLKLPVDVPALGSTDKLEIYDYPGEYAQRFDGVNRSGGDQSAELQKIFEDNKRTAKVRMEEEALGSLTIQGASDCRQFICGHKFTLEKHFNADGVYVLTSVMHTAGMQGYRSGEPPEFSYHNTFTCIPRDLPFRPLRVTPKPVVMGTQTAVVVGSGAANEEFLVDRHGRVKVQFHWDRSGPHNADQEQGTFKSSSCWVRVVQPWAGKTWGAFFWPRIGQEVVVAFQEGDPDQPIIVGSVYNAEQRPPYLGDDRNPSPDPKHKHDPKLSGIKTSTTLGGVGFNELRFDDTKDKQQVFIHAERDLDTRVKNETRELVLLHRHLIVGNEKDKKGDQRELVCRDKHLNVKGSQAELIEGAMLLTVGGDQDHVVKGVKKDLIEKDNHVHVKGARKEKVDMDQSLTVGMNQHEKVGMNHALDAGMAIHLKAGMTVVIEAGVQLTLKAGGSFIDISPAGIAINGVPMLLLNSGGAAGAGAGASPTAPEDAKEAKPTKPDLADDAKTGQKSAP
jgi:type VI secretion system secreted protein VgrG